MKRRHKNKIIFGLVIWIALLPVIIAAAFRCAKIMNQPGRESACTAYAALVIVLMLVHYAVFFWGGSHLAKAKGHSNGLLIVGIIWPVQLIILAILLFAMPDKYARHSKLTANQRQGMRMKHLENE